MKYKGSEQEKHQQAINQCSDLRITIDRELKTIFPRRGELGLHKLGIIDYLANHHKYLIVWQ